MSKLSTLTPCLISTLLLILLQAAPLFSEEPDKSPTISLSGNHCLEGTKKLSVNMIETVGLTDVRFDDPFEQKEMSYSGIWLHQFVQNFGREGVSSVTFTAIDDYEVTFSKKDWQNEKILVVTRMASNHIDLEHKGPVRIVYPDYNIKNYDSKENMPKWIWMIKRAKFK